MTLTVLLVVAALHLGVEEGRRCHCMLYALHFVWGIRDQSGGDRVVALLDRTRPCNSYIQHGSFISAVAFIW